MKTRAFTLLELLVVVSIISILAAIAVPSYYDALIRTRIAQVKAELRTLGIALESYRVDHNMFPRKNSNLEFFAVYLLPELTSPIPYLNQVRMEDPFGPVVEYEPPRFTTAEGSDSSKNNVAGLVRNSYTYTPYMNFADILGTPGLKKEAFSVSSVGPDQMDSYIVDFPFPGFYRYPGDTVFDSVYNPSNGVRSAGDIGFFGGDLSKQGLVGG